MPAEDTVAKLNRIGGKVSSSQKTRLRARVTDLFSPEKGDQASSTNESQNRRGSGQLQRRRVSKKNAASTGRRNSLSLPDDEEEDTPAPKPKPKIRVGLKKSKAIDKRSPLKKHGYNLDHDEHSGINLTDSPSRNTRSKNSNPLEVLRRAGLSIPENLDREDAIQNDPEKESTRHVVPIDGPNPRKRVAGPDTSSTDRDHAESNQLKRAKIDHRVVREPNIANDNEEEPHSSKVHETIDAAPERKRGPGRPRKTAKENERAEEIDVARRHRLAIQQEQREQAIQQEKTELEGFQKKYIATIKDVANVHDCAELWSRVGGAALVIRKKHGPEMSQSVRGKSVGRVVTGLKKSYEALRLASGPVLSNENNVKEHLNKLEGRLKLLDRTKGHKESRQIVQDTFLVLIPSLVMTLRRCLAGRGRDGTLPMSARRELLLLLDLTINTCDKARAWRPRPDLDWGIRLYVRNEILANLKLIRKSFGDETDLHDRRDQEHLQLQDLGKRSQTQHQKLMERYAQEQKIKLQRRMSKLTSSVERGTASKNVQQGSDSDDDLVDGTIHDIDHIGSLPAATPPVVSETAGRKQGSTRTNVQGERLRLQREPTADLPPPLSVDLSEEEKVALLNGLQCHTGKDRYSEILSDKIFGVILRKRDLDDLVKAARSFSQTMASKMGVEAYQAEKSLWWLRSADSDA